MLRSKVLNKDSGEAVEILESLGAAQKILAEVASDAQDAVVELVGVESGIKSVAELRVLECVNKIVLLNNLMGNSPVTQINPNHILSALSKQEKIFLEERNETFEALRHECLVEVIDGLSDMFVVHVGFEHLSTFISVEDVESGRATEDILGHTGGALHSEGVAVLANSIRESLMNSYNIARIASEKLFLGKLGVDPTVYSEAVIEALELVCENNLSKVTDDFGTASLWYENMSEGFKPDKVLLDGVTWYCIKDENGKVRKPFDYQSVDLSVVMGKLLSGVSLDKIVPQGDAYESFLKATKGV